MYKFYTTKAISFSIPWLNTTTYFLRTVAQKNRKLVTIYVIDKPNWFLCNWHILFDLHTFHSE